MTPMTDGNAADGSHKGRRVHIPEDDSAVVSENIRKARKARGMNQTELAAAMRAKGFDTWRQNTVSLIENGQRSTDDLDELQALSAILAGDDSGGDIMAGTSVAQAMHGVARSMMNTMKPAATRSGLRELRKHLDAARAELSELDDVVETLEAYWRDSDDGESS